MKKCTAHIGKVKALLAYKPASKYMIKKYGYAVATEKAFKKSLIRVA